MPNLVSHHVEIRGPDASRRLSSFDGSIGQRVELRTTKEVLEFDLGVDSVTMKNSDPRSLWSRTKQFFRCMNAVHNLVSV